MEMITASSNSSSSAGNTVRQGEKSVIAKAVRAGIIGKTAATATANLRKLKSKKLTDGNGNGNDNNKQQ